MPFIYIMTNPAYEGYVKIGSTDNGKTDRSVEERRQELSNPSGVMFPFEVYAYYETDKNVPDKSIHLLLDTINPDLRANKRREFYKMTPEQAYTVLEAMANLHGASDKLTLCYEGPTDKVKSKTKLKIKPRFSFESAGIPVGSELTYVDDRTIIAKVRGDGQKNIEYNGKPTSLTELATKLQNSSYALQGTLYFEYKGEILSERRHRLEQEGKYK